MSGLTKDKMDKLNRTGPYSRDAAAGMTDSLQSDWNTPGNPKEQIEDATEKVLENIGIGIGNGEFMRIRIHGVLFDCMKAPEHSVCRFCCKPIAGELCAIAVEKSGKKLVMGDIVCELCSAQAPWEEKARRKSTETVRGKQEGLGPLNCNSTQHNFNVFPVREECVLAADKKTTTKHVTHWIQFCTRCGLTLSDSYDDHYKTEGDHESI